MDKAIKRILCMASVLIMVGVLGCDSEELMDESQIYGRWEWIETYQYGLGGGDTFTPQMAGYMLHMNIVNSDTIEHFRNDTLTALSLIKSKVFYSDRVEMVHVFIDSIDWGNGMEPFFDERKLICNKDTAWSVTTDVTDFFASIVYVKR